MDLDELLAGRTHSPIMASAELKLLIKSVWAVVKADKSIKRKRRRRNPNSHYVPKSDEVAPTMEMDW